MSLKFLILIPVASSLIACGSDTSQMGMMATAPACSEVQSSLSLQIDSELSQLQPLLHVRPDATIEVRNETLTSQEFYFGCDSDPDLKGRRLDAGETAVISLMDHLRETSCEIYIHYAGMSRTVQIQVANACR